MYILSFMTSAVFLLAMESVLVDFSFERKRIYGILES